MCSGCVCDALAKCYRSWFVRLEVDGRKLIIIFMGLGEKVDLLIDNFNDDIYTMSEY